MNIKMFDRIISLIGENNLNKIKKVNILLIGVGGVGGTIAESLIRSGIENITLVDYDKIDISNLNRQIIANNNNIGKYKVEEFKERIKSINDKVKVKVIKEKINKDNISLLFEEKYDYIIDACDTIIVKKLLIKECKERNIKLVTVCGMGNKLHPELIKICDIKDTSYDPIAKILRKYIKEEKIKGRNICISSEEKAIKNDKVISSMMMVPSTAGLLASSYIINDIIECEEVK